MHQRDPQTSGTPVLPAKYYPAHSLLPLEAQNNFLLLSFLYKCIVLCWRCPVSCSSKQPLWVTFSYWSFSQMMCATHMNKLFGNLLLICPFVKESQPKPKQVEVNFCFSSIYMSIKIPGVFLEHCFVAYMPRYFYFGLLSISSW